MLYRDAFEHLQAAATDKNLWVVVAILALTGLSVLAQSKPSIQSV